MEVWGPLPWEEVTLLDGGLRQACRLIHIIKFAEDAADDDDDDDDGFF